MTVMTTNSVADAKDSDARDAERDGFAVDFHRVGHRQTVGVAWDGNHIARAEDV